MDSLSGREPTAHERRAGVPWDASYRDGRAPWDLGRPQPAIARLAADGAFVGAVLDAGCGSGENALHIAEAGTRVLGILDRLDRSFDTVLDCGLFHTLDGAERSAYVTALASVTLPGAILFVLCFRQVTPERVGPHPVSENELRAAFPPGGGWTITDLEQSEIEVNFDASSLPGWLAKVRAGLGVEQARSGSGKGWVLGKLAPGEGHGRVGLAPGKGRSRGS